MPSKGRSPGTRRVYRYDWFPPGPPNLKIPLGPALPSLLGPRETIPSLQSRMLPPPTTKWHFKEKCQLVAVVCSDPPCVSAGCLLFACFSVTRPQQCWDRLGFRGVWPQIIAQGRGRVSEVGSSPCKGWNFFPSVSEFGSPLTECCLEEPVLLVLLDLRVTLRAATPLAGSSSH